MVGEGRPRRWRRNLLVGCLAVLLVIAVVWGGTLRDAADLSAARAAVAARDWPRAEALLRAGLGAGRTRSGDAERHFLLGRSLRRQRRFAEAEREFAAAVGAGWPAGAVERQRLLARAQGGEVHRVEEPIVRSMGEAEDDAYAEDCYEALAEGFVAAYRMPDARKCIGFWSQWRPDDPLPAYWSGVVEERFLHPVQALEQYHRALELDPGLQTARLAAARLELDTGRLEEARRHFGEYLDVRPDEPAAVMGLADCLVRLGEPARARERYLDALTTDVTPEQASAALTELAQMALGDGEEKRAGMLLEEAVAVDPRGTRARLSYAAVLARVGDREGAERERAEAERMAALQRRLAEITHDLLGSPGDVGARAEAGAIFLEEGFEREGLQWLESALAYDPDHGPTHRVLADWYESRGEDGPAAEHRRRAGAAERPGRRPSRGDAPAAATERGGGA